jgi:hypothetical protein
LQALNYWLFGGQPDVKITHADSGSGHAKNTCKYLVSYPVVWFSAQQHLFTR